MIKILCVGKIKESFYKDAIKEYLKRLSKYHKIIIDEVNDSNINKEKELLINHINIKDYVVVFDIDGKEMNSLEFSQFIDKTLMVNSNIVFIIGGSDGVHEDIKKMANYRLSFSKMTFPHQLFRVICLEQIYRSFKILNNETYHK
ncbi:MAG: 23S rRNA (pseudouridine(1915)-N(3))-methyltransferase RlmH [Bacilli bacterium]|nr:23S rRNA (pseudouridine(1915)-N(3))-methyltransferase RlmH [Bacilli bacterium]